MNLIEATLRASEEHLHVAKTNSYEAYQKFSSLSLKDKECINGFFEILLGYQFEELLYRCGGVIQKPLTRSIAIT